tara:strand:- start:11195 stop:11362 length:168 start_codon:yes stop_codon:yes gene_type:complete
MNLVVTSKYVWDAATTKRDPVFHVILLYVRMDIYQNVNLRGDVFVRMMLGIMEHV